jgi:ATP-dependent DNA helicase RecQ
MSLQHPGTPVKTPGEVLKQFWNFDQFRPLQENIINAVLSGKDSLALMPTGGGKSLCYQVPALCAPGICLVISPLIALMKDQVENLRKRNITAFAIYSGMTRKEVINILKVSGSSNCKFLYVSPERLETSLFKEYLPGMDINLIAVDEAHCISQWGYDFRPPYLRIAAIRQELPGVPILALTASATPDVQNDICKKLELIDPAIFRQSFERPKLSYSVFKVDARINKIIEVLQKVPGSAIIYCRNRKRCKEISGLLQLHDISADYYHAGLGQEERSKKQSDWVNDKIRVIVCTNAFGMGIDKPDVRIVIHAEPPDCLENYYQEAGRAGRDGKMAYAVLLYDERDLKDLAHLGALQFPSLAEIRSVYQAVANYLQIPTGEGNGNYFDFDLADFLKKFKLNSHTVLYALKALEQDGWLTLNEQVFLPSLVRFTTNKNELFEFKTHNPALEPIIMTLLRSYEGILDHPSRISEKMIAGWLKKEEPEIKKQLQILAGNGLIEYEPQKNTPQLFFLRERIRSEDITIDMQAFNERKERFQKRMKEMLSYIKEESECRAKNIAGYFGDRSVKVCGVCDNCLRQKAIILSPEEFDALHYRIVNIVKYESLTAKDLLTKLTGVKKEKAWKVLEFLQAERRLGVDGNGFVRMM